MTTEDEYLHQLDDNLVGECLKSVATIQESLEPLNLPYRDPRIQQALDGLADVTEQLTAWRATFWAGARRDQPASRAPILSVQDGVRRHLSETTEALDEQVHDAKGEEAANINNEGRAAQIAYLAGVSVAEVQAIAQAAGLEVEEPQP